MDLPHTWMIGSDIVVHSGFGVCKLIGRTSSPVGCSGDYSTAEQAVVAAETLGAEYAAFRMTECKGRVEPFERITRTDLPVFINGKSF